MSCQEYGLENCLKVLCFSETSLTPEKVWLTLKEKIGFTESVSSVWNILLNNGFKYKTMEKDHKIQIECPNGSILNNTKKRPIVFMDKSYMLTLHVCGKAWSDWQIDWKNNIPSNSPLTFKPNSVCITRNLRKALRVIITNLYEMYWMDQVIGIHTISNKIKMCPKMPPLFVNGHLG